ncbi:MAG: SMI1/KNR4 family protein [Anaerolineales bacterium]
MEMDRPAQARGSAIEAVEHLQAALARLDLYELKFDYGVSLEAIQEVEQELGVQFPRSYIDLMTTYGPFAVCEKDEDFEDGLFRLFTLDEIIDLTLENRELYLEDYFDPEEDEDLIEVFNRLVFFQFADYPWIENYYGFYRPPDGKAVVLRMDHDDIELLLDQGLDFDDHTWNLVEEILSEGEE